MVPASFVLVDALPLTPNGKVDYQKLPAPESDRETSVGYVAPRTPIEEVLANTWAEALGVERVGIYDNFFGLGGHSLLTMQIIDRLNKAGLGLTVAQTFQHQTVAELAAVVNPNQAVRSDSGDWSSLLTLQPHGTQPPLFLVHTAPGDVLGYLKLVYYLGNDQPCYGFQSLGLLRPEASHRRLEEMAAHYVRLMREFQPQGPYFLGGWCFGGTVAMEMAHQLVEQGQKVALLALMETWAHHPPKTYVRFHLHHLRCLLRAGPRALTATWLRKVRRWRGKSEAPANQLAEFAFEVATTGPLANRSHVYPINLAATRRYQSRSRLYPGHVTLFRRRHHDAIDAVEPDCGFVTLVKELEICYVPGDHRSVLKDPHVRTLAEEIKKCLARAQAGSASSVTGAPLANGVNTNAIESFAGASR
jgi:thioesterase domain-containing protein